MRLEIDVSDPGFGLILGDFPALSCGDLCVASFEQPLGARIFFLSDAFFGECRFSTSAFFQGQCFFGSTLFQKSVFSEVSVFWGDGLFPEVCLFSRKSRGLFQPEPRLTS